MKHPGLFAVLALASLPLLADPGAQEPGGEGPASQEPERAPFASFKAKERVRIDQALQGSWILNRHESPAGGFDPGDIRGFAMFAEGFMTIVIQARSVDDAFLFPDRQYFIQAGAYRYRISDELALQTASVMGFSNANEGFQLTFEPSSRAREYSLDLTEDLLTLGRTDGTRFHLSRVHAGAFPQDALDALARKLPGAPATPDEPR